MNSEELELSLRTEFENYLKGVLAEMRHEVAEFQTKFVAELEKHRAQVDEAFRAFSSRLDSENEFDEAFRASVSEHLRLARDEGAKITAEAFAEAEKLEKETAPPPVYNVIRDAVADVSRQDSQSGILKALVQHAADFAPRGAFFILKNEHLAGWKVFGASADAEEAVREVHFPIASDTVLSAAVRDLETVESAAGGHAEDSIFLEKLGFERPDHMFAIPLIARGKAVAVLYADYGDGGAHLNREALETLVSVAGLTVELHAVTQSTAAPAAAPEPKAQPEPQPEETPAPQQYEHSFGAPPSQDYEEPVSQPEPEPAYEQPRTDFSFDNAPTYTDSPFEQPATASVGYDSYEEAVPEHVPEPVPEYATVSENVNGSGGHAMFDAPRSLETTNLTAPPFDVATQFEQAPQMRNEYVPEPVAEPQMRYTPAPQPEFTPAPIPAPQTELRYTPEPQAQPMQTPQVDMRPAPQAPPQYAPVPEPPPAAPAVEKTIQPVGQVASTPVPRLSDRPVDLPIDVPEQERRLHNDARRFARLLVSEIKLYNEKKVQEGRQEYDLYERLKEAIDRSREMYDKRVQPPVAARFDYFHYELVNSLAEGNAERLGEGYPGPTA